MCYGSSAIQVKDLLGVMKHFQDSVFHLVVKILSFVGLAHPYMPTVDRDQLVIDYLVWASNKKALQWDLTANTPAVAGTVQVKEQYLSVENFDCSACKTFRVEADPNQLRPMVCAHSTHQSAIQSYG